MQLLVYESYFLQSLYVPYPEYLLVQMSERFQNFEDSKSLTFGTQYTVTLTFSSETGSML